MKKKAIYIILSVFLVLSVALNVVQLTKRGNGTLKFSDYVYSVVEVKASTEDVGESFGTAEFINSNGVLVTNAHVITYKKMGVVYTFENVSVRFSFENDYHKVSIVKFDTTKDVAVLQLDDTSLNFKPLKMGDSSKLNYNQEIFAIGNLNNLGLSITKGIISNPSLNVTYEDNTRNVIQCDLTIADGNSGGALLDNTGKLVGLTTFRLKDNKGNVIYGIAYCIPINTILEYIENV